MKLAAVGRSISISATLLAACPGAKHPAPPAGSLTLEIGGSLRGVAGDAGVVFTATTVGDRTTIAARRGSQIAWQRELAGTGGAIARAGDLVVATLSGTGMVAGVALRGGPGAVVVALDAATGAPKWTLAIDASEWSLCAAIAAIGNDVVVGGSFQGTLRANARVVSSAGKADGFVARVTAAGEVAWLARVGGPNADGVQGVAVAGPRIAIAGTFSPGAELFGQALPSADESSPHTDVFVAELDGSGARKWQAVFGGKSDDSTAGVAIDGKGRIAVAATVREGMRINLSDVIAQGPADGLVEYFGRDGTAGPSVVLGGAELDGLSAITASGDHVVAGGFFAGQMLVGREPVKSTGGDDAYLLELDGGDIVHFWPIAGAGREEITALAPVPGGFVAGLAHTAAASIDGQPLAVPADPMRGAAVLVRATR